MLLFLRKSSEDHPSPLKARHTLQNPSVQHRDMKPDNVLLDGQMHARLSDFGVARVFSNLNATHTNTNTTAGTRHYICPDYQETGN